jgi:hypothetical protein
VKQTYALSSILVHYRSLLRHFIKLMQVIDVLSVLSLQFYFIKLQVIAVLVRCCVVCNICKEVDQTC